jgi:hypothetical protein
MVTSSEIFYVRGYMYILNVTLRSDPQVAPADVGCAEVTGDARNNMSTCNIPSLVMVQSLQSKLVQL